jgi:hypothetical protein
MSSKGFAAPSWALRLDLQQLCGHCVLTLQQLCGLCAFLPPQVRGLCTFILPQLRGLCAFLPPAILMGKGTEQQEEV